MKKFLIAVVGCAAFAVMAGPHGCGGHHHGSDGVRLATDIVDLVGASLNILAPRTVVTTPVVTPVVAPVAPVVTVPAVAPVVVRPVVYPYRRYCRPCRPYRHCHRPRGGCHRR
ncbi:MAG: hypothetical protein MJ033_01500 [Victivallaceae bacterium]|nr:hypothetical protein [Victivallaceae bacterium]